MGVPTKDEETATTHKQGKQTVPKIKSPYTMPNDVTFRLNPNTGFGFRRPLLNSVDDDFRSVVDVSFYLKLSSLADGRILYASSMKNMDFLRIAVRSGKMTFSFDAGSGKRTIDDETSLSVGRWHHVRAYRNGSAFGLFVDGEGRQTLVGDSLPIEFLDLDGDFRLGASMTSSSVVGCLADFDFGGWKLVANPMETCSPSENPKSSRNSSPSFSGQASSSSERVSSATAFLLFVNVLLVCSTLRI